MPHASNPLNCATLGVSDNWTVFPKEPNAVLTAHTLLGAMRLCPCLWMLHIGSGFDFENPHRDPGVLVGSCRYLLSFHLAYRSEVRVRRSWCTVFEICDSVDSLLNSYEKMDYTILEQMCSMVM